MEWISGEDKPQKYVWALFNPI